MVRGHSPLGSTCRGRWGDRPRAGPTRRWSTAAQDGNAANVRKASDAGVPARGLRSSTPDPVGGALRPQIELAIADTILPITLWLRLRDAATQSARQAGSAGMFHISAERGIGGRDVDGYPEFVDRPDSPTTLARWVTMWEDERVAMASTRHRPGSRRWPDTRVMGRRAGAPLLRRGRGRV